MKHAIRPWMAALLSGIFLLSCMIMPFRSVYADTGSGQGERVKTTREEEGNRPLNGDYAEVKSFKVLQIIDGTAPFDTSKDPASPYYENRPGNDSGNHNLIVRSYDKIFYDLSCAVEAYKLGDQFSSAVVEFEFILPCSKDQAAWDMSSMTWLDSGAKITTKSIRYDFNGDGKEETKVCQILRGKKTLLRTDAQPTVIPGSGIFTTAVDVKAMKRGDQIRPIFTAWMQYNRAGNRLLSSLPVVTTNTLSGKGRSRVSNFTTIPKSVTVTSEPRLNIQLNAMPSDFTAADTYNFNTGNDKALDRGLGLVKGKADSIGITVQLYNHLGRGMKGIEIPKGPIQFDLLMNTTFKAADPKKALTKDQEKDVSKNYAPLILSYGPQGEKSADERDMKELPSYSVLTAPGNSGMVTLPSDHCYQGGNWSLKRIGLNHLRFVVSDYEIRMDRFPNADLGDAVTLPKYFDPKKGVDNIGCFSAGALWIVTPFQNNGTTDPSQKGKTIAEEYGRDGTFVTTVRDLALKANGINGDSLPAVADNSNQTNKGDDAVDLSIYMSPKGEYAWVTAWTKFSKTPSSYALPDVIGRDISQQGSWAYNGRDAVVTGQDISLGFGIHGQENGYNGNRIVAGEILSKFDADGFVPNGKYSSSGITDFGLDLKILYGVKKDGSNWKSQDEMNRATVGDLKYYSELSQIPKGEKCVALLAELRPTGGNPALVKKWNEGSRNIIVMDGAVPGNPSLIGKVFSTVIGGYIYSMDDYKKVGANLVSMVGNNPASPVTEPKPSFESYPSYVKAVYADKKYVGTPTNGQSRGDSFCVQTTLPEVRVSISQQQDGHAKDIYQLDGDERYVDYVIYSYAGELPKGLHEKVNIEVTDVLDKNLSYVEGSAYLGGEYHQNSVQGQKGTITGGKVLDPQITTDSLGRTILRWSFKGLSTNEAYPVIRFTAKIGNKSTGLDELSHNQQIRNVAIIRADGDMRSATISNKNMSDVDFVVAKLKFSAISIFQDEDTYNAGDAMRYEISAGNNGSTPLPDLVVLNSIPYSGDQAGSRFSGTLTVTDAVFNKENLKNPEEWTCYYSTDLTARGTVSAQYTPEEIRAGEARVSGHKVSWKKAVIHPDGRIEGLENKAVTAIVWIGKLYEGDAVKAHISLKNPGTVGGDSYVTTLTQGYSKTAAGFGIVDRKISGMPWVDTNGNGIRETAESALSGVKVVLLKKDKDNYQPYKDEKGNIISVVTSGHVNHQTFLTEAVNNAGKKFLLPIVAGVNADGGYEFANLPSGEYALLFESDQANLQQYAPSPINAGNDSRDSDATPFFKTFGGCHILFATGIQKITLPALEAMQGPHFISANNDSGFVPLPMMKITAHKVWKGISKNYPEIYFTLYRKVQNEEPSPVITKQGHLDVQRVGSTNKVEFGSFPAVDAAGNKIEYLVRETDSKGKSLTPAGFSKSEDGLTVTNEYVLKPQPSEHTGDGINISVYALIALLSSIGFAVSLRKKKDLSL